jgi:hypothetical protein
MKTNAKKAEITPKRVTLAIEKFLDHAAADVRKGRQFWINLAAGGADVRKGPRELRQG